jgi:hypothetical protein
MMVMMVLLDGSGDNECLGQWADASHRGEVSGSRGGRPCLKEATWVCSYAFVTKMRFIFGAPMHLLQKWVLMPRKKIEKEHTHGHQDFKDFEAYIDCCSNYHPRVRLNCCKRISFCRKLLLS